MASLSSKDEKYDASDVVQPMTDSQTVSLDKLDELETSSTVERPSPLPPPVRDGGTRAWLQVAGSFLVFINMWGFTFAYGTFQSYYELYYLPNDSASDISWIGTTASWLLICIGVFSGPLFDLGYFKTLLFAGAFLETLSVFLLSLSRKYYQIMLTQSIMQGLGNGLLYLPALALVGRSFKKHRSIALATVSAGAPLGGIIYTLLFERLISTHSFASTVRAMGYFMLGAYAAGIPLLLYKADNLGDLASGSKRKLFDRTALRDIRFWTYTSSNFCIFLGYMVPFVYIGTYGQTELGMSQSSSLNVIIYTQAASIAGRLVLGFVASRTGPLGPWFLCAVCSGVCMLGWLGVRSEASFIVTMCLFGFFSGGLIPLPPSVFPLVCPDPAVLGARLGMAQAIGSIASLVGSPIAGALLRPNAGRFRDYLGLQVFSGFVMLAGSCGLVTLWVLLNRKKRRDAGG